MTKTIQTSLPGHGTRTGEAFCTSGTSPTTVQETPTTLHLVGPGQVGQAFLRQLPGTPFHLVGITDTTATLHARDGLEPLALADHKSGHRSLLELPDAESLPLGLALDFVNADVVVDATPSGVDGAAAVRRNLRLLNRGKSLVLASKDTLCHAAVELLSDRNRDRVGIQAVLGGTGAALLQDLDELRRDCRDVALVGNASTTAVIEAIERGESIDVGIAGAQRAGILEPEPELDLAGIDAAVKLIAVVGALWGCTTRLGDVARQHLRHLDVGTVRRRHARGFTTRLVARAHCTGGGLWVAFEEIHRSSPLAVPSTHVAYTYRLPLGQTRVHVGHGIGPRHTAAALLHDVRQLAGRAS